MSAINTSHPSFTGRTAVITGGSSGIGLTTALLLSSLGCNVLIGDLQPPAPSVSLPPNVVYHQTDVLSYPSLLALFRFSKAHFGVYPDLIYANAGISEKGKLFGGGEEEDIEQEPDHKTLRVDLEAVANTVRIGWWGVRQEKKEGVIVVTASMAGYAGQMGLPMYNAAKHGCVGLVRSLRYLGPSQGISISLVAPAITTTPLLVSPLPYAKSPSSAPDPTGRGSSLTSLSHMEDPAAVTSAFKSAGVPVNTPDDVAHVVVGLMGEGKGSNGKGVLVQGGLCSDLERGIAGCREEWMGGEGRMARLYKGGSGGGVGIGTGTGTGGKKEAKL
ncbi:hypothetical protein BCR35DRAFT_329809 [Leucosporidium creatinivorum]|uniref:NAD(P)-binding protein n=1 Tax=Leucosporidium creatinivorum TaxID=106004 RepID=A0A1Y2FWY2_9BASI|nr:hypothetical protein BCR35DRAFT_329809 [Leucosporidium creatinivorum]